ncbi:hypothetical protein LUZ60_017268 [Juncus effusus]|nr:hypothetical protein LUZ60_017268 [Juncus effusus]
MSGQALRPWPVHYFPLVLLLLTCYNISVFASDAEILLKFRDSLTVDSGGTPTLNGWGQGDGPCNGIVPLWQGVICNINGTVLGLQLENMRLTGTLKLDLLMGISKIRALSFANNNFTGPIPDISILGALKMVYLQHNLFNGEIPGDMFAKMHSLKKVHLSYNEFTGRIPWSLTVPPRMLELGLDHNHFEGQIPDFRQDTFDLANMAYNNLTGQIPAAFSKLDAGQFEGNKDLCGAPLSTACSSTLSPPSSQAKSTTSKKLLIAIILISIALLCAILCLCIVIFRRRDSANREIQSPALVTLPSAKSKYDLTGMSSGDQGAGPSGRRTKRDHDPHGKLSFIREERERFEIEDLLRASAEVLGSGNFGSSYKATLFDGPSVVVKRFREMNGVGREDFTEHMRRLGRLSHPNLLPIVAYLYKKEEKLLVLDYVSNGSLAHMLHGNHSSHLPPLDWPTRLKVIKGVTRGLAYLYEELPMLKVPHGHLKSSNILLNDSFEPLLTDYSLVPVMTNQAASQIMVAYKSPECAASGRPSNKSDVWSLGILILEILTGKFPANYLRQGNAGTDLASWVNSVVREEWTGEVFDTEMKNTANAEGEMIKLLKIGLGCCELDLDKRWDVHHVLSRIEELNEKDSDGEFSSFDE